MSFAAKAAIILRNQNNDGTYSTDIAILLPGDTFIGFSLSSNGVILRALNFEAINGYNYVAFG